MDVFPLLMLAVLVLIFWLMVIRPAKARQSEAQRLRDSISVGQRIMTTAGVFGTVESIDEDQISVGIADGVVIRMIKLGIAYPVDEQGKQLDPNRSESTATSEPESPSESPTIPSTRSTPSGPDAPQS